MPFFRVLLHGDGIHIRSTPTNAKGLDIAPRGNTIVGFYTTRYVYARNNNSAAMKAICKEQGLWSCPPYSQLDRCKHPKLTAEDIDQVDIITGFFGKPRKGHTFYSDESGGDGARQSNA